MKYVDIMNAFMALKDIANSGQSMPGKLGIAIARNLQKMEPIVKIISEEEMKAAEQFGTEQEDGKYVDATGHINFENTDKANEFKTYMDNIYSIDEDIQFIKVSDNDISNINITIPQALALTFMIE